MKRSRPLSNSPPALGFTFRLIICSLHPRIHIEKTSVKSNSSLEETRKGIDARAWSESLTWIIKCFPSANPVRSAKHFRHIRVPGCRFTADPKGRADSGSQVHCCQLFSLAAARNGPTRAGAARAGNAPVASNSLSKSATNTWASKYVLLAKINEIFKKT